MIWVVKKIFYSDKSFSKWTQEAVDELHLQPIKFSWKKLLKKNVNNLKCFTKHSFKRLRTVRLQDPKCLHFIDTSNLGSFVSKNDMNLIHMLKFMSNMLLVMQLVHLQNKALLLLGEERLILMLNQHECLQILKTNPIILGVEAKLKIRDPNDCWPQV